MTAGIGGEKTNRIISSLKFPFYFFFRAISKKTFLGYYFLAIISEVISICGELYGTDSKNKQTNIT